jgi:hypothetical protein
MRRLALFAFVLAIAAAGCGGGDGGGALSREEFVAQLDQICADFNEKEDEVGELETLEQIAEQGAVVRREFGAAIERIRNLGEPPEEIRADVNRFLEVSDELHRLIGELVEAAEQNDLEPLRELAEEGAALQEESNEIANRLGAESCAQD